jgi:hypothetical protein
MTSDEWEGLAAAVFADEARLFWSEVAERADLERAFLALEREADRAQCMAEGEHWARTIGMATETDAGTTTARLWEVLLYSHDRDHRERAATLICRRLRRGPRAEAA